MKKSNKIIASAAAFVVLATIGGVVLSANASFYRGSSGERMGLFQGKALNEEQKEEMKMKYKERKAEMEARQAVVNEALAAGSYSAWLEAVGEDCPMAEKINEENFSKFAEAHKKMAEARAIMEELGIERGGFGKVRGFMKHWQ